MTARKLKAGIIGLGVGESHIQGYNNHPACEVVALCDFNNETLEVMKDKYPQMIFSSEAETIIMNPSIHIVSIASYDNYHYEQIIKAIDNNKHVFVEKPLCLYEEEARHIRSLLKEKPHLKMSSNLILRRSPRFRLLKQKIEAGEIGDLSYVEGDYNYGRIHKITEGWRGKIDYYSVVYGGAVHIVDLLLWLTQDEVIEVSAFGNNLATNNTHYKYNDVVVSILRFKSGLIGKVTANFSCVYPHFHRLSIYGTKATFENGIDHACLYTSRDPQADPVIINSEYPGVHKGDLIASFVESIINNTDAEITKDDIFKSMSVCFAIEKAVHQQPHPVTVNYI